jgi:hypothetical protein
MALSVFGSASGETFPVSSPFSMTINTINMTYSNGSMFVVGASPNQLTAAGGVATAYTDVEFPSTGYYTFTVQALASISGAVGAAYWVGLDRHPMDHGYDPISESYYYTVTQTVSSGNYPSAWSAAGATQTVTFYVTAGTHEVEIYYLGARTGLTGFGTITITNATGPAFPPEPPGSRSASSQPFSSWSIWNTALGSGATWSGSVLCMRQANGSAIPNSVPGCDPATTDITSAGATINSGWYSNPTFAAQASDPVQTFVDDSGNAHPEWPNLVINAPGIPSSKYPNATWPDPPLAAQGGDAHLGVFTADKTTLFSGDACAVALSPVKTFTTIAGSASGSMVLDLNSTAGITVNQTVFDATNYNALASPYVEVYVTAISASQVTLNYPVQPAGVGNGDTIQIGTHAGFVCGAVARDSTCGLGQNTGSFAIGTMLQSEINARLIPHMLRFAIPRTLVAPPPGAGIYGGVQWPSIQTYDSCGGNFPGTCYTGHMPTGATIGIPASVNINSLGLTADGLALATALQNYGAMQRDTGGNSGIILYAQTSASFDAATETQINNMIRDLNNIIRPYLRVLTNQGPSSVNGGGTRPLPNPPGIATSTCPLPYPAR